MTTAKLTDEEFAALMWKHKEQMWAEFATGYDKVFKAPEEIRMQARLQLAKAGKRKTRGDKLWEAEQRSLGSKK